jgi:hypothetical protein
MQGFSFFMGRIQLNDRFEINFVKSITYLVEEQAEARGELQA